MAGHCITRTLNGITWRHVKLSWNLDYKGPSSQGYGFSCGHVWMRELDCEEGWMPKNWCFWSVVLEKTLESPLDCKEIQPAHPKGHQSWIFIGRTDAEAEAPILWPPDGKFSSVQFTSVQLLSCVWLCDPMECSAPGFPVHHQRLELTQTHVHWVSDVIQTSNPLATWCEELTHWKRPWCLERLNAGGGDDRRWNGWMASLTQWTWVWANSRSWWRTG